MTFDNYIHIALDIKELYNLFDGFVSKLIRDDFNKI
jgi:hypothetical protein